MVKQESQTQPSNCKPALPCDMVWANHIRQNERIFVWRLCLVTLFFLTPANVSENAKIDGILIQHCAGAVLDVVL